jgi:flagellar biosynthesis chaperone FliJ
MMPLCVSITRAAIEVDELRKQAQAASGDASKRLTSAQRDRQAAALKFDGLTARQKERLNSEGIGKRESGFSMTQWSWGWRKDIE